MRQRCLDAVDSLDQCVFQCAGALFEHRSQRHACQLFRAAFADLSQHCKSRLVAGGRTQGMEQHPSQPKSRNNQTADQIVGQLIFAFHQAMHDANDDKIRCHRESDSDNCKEDAQNVLSFVFSCLPQRPRDWRRSFLFCFHKQTSLMFC